ncbi:MAG: glycosyltransferase family 4 protein, partial [Rubricoccaceae bacterium]|nr:glycosyltransferase family 4 protein [Rubricoccaceae bacterium]
MHRVLIISYYFPPSGGAGVQRVLKWTKYLRDFDVEPVVLTVESGAYPQLDPTLRRDLPDGIEIHRTKAVSPFGLYAKITGRSRQDAVDATTGHIGKGAGLLEKSARWIRANVFVPDARVGWGPFAIRKGKSLIGEADFSAVITSGPPHSVHLIGRALHRTTTIPWVADFRDPWTDISYYDELPRSRLVASFDKRLERAVLAEATSVITVSPTWRDTLLQKVDRKPKDFHVIQNGFDPEDFLEEVPLPYDGIFVLSYVGSLYGSRNPDALFAAIKHLRDGNAIQRFRLRLIGRIGEDVRQQLVERGLSEIVDIVPYLPHREAIVEMRRANALLLTIEPYKLDKGNLTGKIYEYLASGRPIVALGPVGGDADRLLQKTGGGRLFGRDDTSGISDHLSDLYATWERGESIGG